MHKSFDIVCLRNIARYAKRSRHFEKTFSVGKAITFAASSNK